MNDEEKKAFEFIRDLIAWDVRQDLCPNKEECKNLEIILNLIEKQKKEIDLCEETEIALNNRIMDLEGITIENSPFQNYQLDILRENFIPIWRIKNLIKELKQDDINMTRKYKEKKNITGELLGIDKVRVRAYREKTREIKEKIQKLLND